MPQAQQFQSKTHSKNTPTNIIHFLLAACCRMQQCLNKIKSKQPWKKNKKNKQTTIDQLLLKQSLEQTELSCWIGGSMHVCKSTVTVTWKSRICKNVSLIFQLIWHILPSFAERDNRSHPSWQWHTLVKWLGTNRTSENNTHTHTHTRRSRVFNLIAGDRGGWGLKREECL